MTNQSIQNEDMKSERGRTSSVLSQSAIKKWKSPRRTLQFLFHFFLILLAHDSLVASNDVNKFQKVFLESQILQEVEVLILNWQEERYADGIYVQGERMSQRVISREEFASEMVAKDWRIISSSETGKVEKIEFLNLLIADVYLSLGFKHNINVNNEIKKNIILRITLENHGGEKKWKFNLLQLVDLPY